jgi:hypothetical protein
MAKSKSKKPIAPSWKQVEISGGLIAEGADFDGFAGLEVLENYDSSFLKGAKKPRVRKLWILKIKNNMKTLVFLGFL